MNKWNIVFCLRLKMSELAFKRVYDAGNSLHLSDHGWAGLTERARRSNGDDRAKDWVGSSEDVPWVTNSEFVTSVFSLISGAFFVVFKPRGWLRKQCRSSTVDSCDNLSPGIHYVRREAVLTPEVNLRERCGANTPITDVADFISVIVRWRRAKDIFFLLSFVQFPEPAQKSHGWCCTWCVSNSLICLICFLSLKQVS